jgi:hypothetical protein
MNSGHRYAIAITCLAATAVYGDDKLAGELESARAAFATQIEAAQTRLLEAVDAEIKKAAKSGSLIAVKTLQDEKNAIESDFEYESKATRLRPAILRYQSDSKTARDKLRTLLARAVVEYTKAMQFTEAESVDAELKTLDKTGRIPAKAKTKAKAEARQRELKSGLLVLLFHRLPSQQGDDGFVNPAEFVGPTSDPTIVESIENLQYDAERNAVAFGYLRIDEPGEYRFRTYNFYDRNALLVGGQIVCPYRGSVANGTEPADRERITLRKGYVPIAVAGYVDGRGSVAVTWMPPGQNAYAPIPKELLFHDPADTAAK